MYGKSGVTVNQGPVIRGSIVLLYSYNTGKLLSWGIYRIEKIYHIML